MTDPNDLPCDYRYPLFPRHPRSAQFCNVVRSKHSAEVTTHPWQHYNRVTNTMMTEGVP